MKLYFTEEATRGVLWKKVLSQDFIKKETPAQVFSCEFGEISKNTLFTEHLCTTASDFICGVFFIFSIIKNFRLEKSRFVRKKSTSGKAA